MWQTAPQTAHVEVILTTEVQVTVAIEIVTTPATDMTTTAVALAVEDAQMVAVDSMVTSEEMTTVAAGAIAEAMVMADTTADLVGVMAPEDATAVAAETTAGIMTTDETEGTAVIPVGATAIHENVTAMTDDLTVAIEAIEEIKETTVNNVGTQVKIVKKNGVILLATRENHDITAITRETATKTGNLVTEAREVTKSTRSLEKQTTYQQTLTIQKTNKGWKLCPSF